MNYLAHLYFASPSPESVLGNVAGDFYKGVVEGDGAFAVALRRHRAVDAFTDAHPSVGASRRRLESRFHHYGRVIVDVFCDHFLAVDWDRYSGEPLAAFCARMNAIIAAHADLLEPAVASRFRRMAAENWLASYGRLEGIRTALYYLSLRLKRPVALDTAVDDLARDYEAFRADFNAFFPELVEHMGAWTKGT